MLLSFKKKHFNFAPAHFPEAEWIYFDVLQM